MTLSTLEENVLKAIGLKGYSRMKELKEDESLQGHSFTDIYNTVKELEKKGILQREIVRISGKGEHAFNVFELKKEGKKEAELLINQPPIQSQKQMLVNKYGSLEIGYIFEECQPLLKDKGIVIEQTDNGHTITINENIYPLFIDAKPKGKERYTRSEYQEKFDKMYAQSSTFFYLSPTFINSSFLILDEVEAWMKIRILNQEEEKPFQFYASYTERILKNEGDHWDSLIDLWTKGILQFSKMPSI